MIPFNKPYLSGDESKYIIEAVKSGKISGNGEFTKKSHTFFEQKYGFQKCLLTSSCTDALEMAAILIDIQAGDEVIMPSYTFVSTANAFILRGAVIRFVDSSESNPNMDTEKIIPLINSRTKAICVVHYAGIANDMDIILDIAHQYGLFVIEDAAQAIDSYYKGKPLGSFGDLAAFSFHETKNIISGEGGMLVVNNRNMFKRAEIIWEKGTNRAEFFRGEVNKYGWVDIGSSFLPSEIIAAFLFAQLENLENIQKQRVYIWNLYKEFLKELEIKNKIKLPFLPQYATNNGHLFYILCSSSDERDQLISFLKKNDVITVFHYISLHSSPYYQNKHDDRILVNSDRYTDTLLRLPLYYELQSEQVELIAGLIKQFYSE